MTKLFCTTQNALGAIGTKVSSKLIQSLMARYIPRGLSVMYVSVAAQLRSGIKAAARRFLMRLRTGKTTHPKLMKIKGKAVMLSEGDIIELREGHKVYANVPEHFLYKNRKGSFEIGRGEVIVGGELSYLAGRYVVYKTTSDGGGTGHGPHDVYPSGHHVFCEKLADRSIRVDFYQSGCFTAMIKDIEPVGKASRSWVEK